MFTWKIKNIEVVNKMKTEGYLSSKEDRNIAADVPWVVHFYPNGRGHNSKDFVSVTVRFNFESTSIVCPSYTWTACLLDGSEKEIYEKESFYFRGQDNAIEQFLDKSVFVAEKDKLYPHGNLTLRCKIYVPSFVCPLEIPLVNKSKFSAFENMLNKQEFSDIKLIANDRVLFAYKGILATKSPVFAAMFAANMQEIKNSVLISDISYNVLHEMLLFMYTGKVNDIHLIAKDLLIAAEKYQIEDLKEICEEALLHNLNGNSIIDSLVIAENYRAKTLKEHALQYFKLNFKELLRNRTFETELSQLLSTLSFLDILKGI